MKLVSVEEMRAIEREADGQGWTYADMMERAGLGLGELVHALYGYADRLAVVGLVGSGNNGGDTLIALAGLAEAGWEARAYLARERSVDDPLVQRLLDAGGTLVNFSDDAGFTRLDAWMTDATVLLDGVLGTGIKLPLKRPLAELLAHVRDSALRPPVAAVDCPSGVDCDSGEAAEEVIPAEMTVCMAAVKQGLLCFPANRACGDLQVVDIGLPEKLAAWDAVQSAVVTEEMVRAWLPERPADGHKGTFGTVMVVGGSLNYSGAVLLAAGGAGKTGAGLVQVALPSVLHAALAGQNLNVTWVLLPHKMGAINADAAGVLFDALDRATAMLVGPGFGLEDCSLDFIKSLLGGRSGQRERGGLGFVPAASARADEPAGNRLPPMVVDADGLKLLAQVADWPRKLPAGSVLTPHPGEMAILTGLEVKAIQADRMGMARRYAAEWGQVVVLKGAFTVIAHPDGRAVVIPVATTALAHGGTGDVLGGMIAALLGQKVDAFQAAACGAWLHAQAGLAAAESVGHAASVQAVDVIEAIPEVLSWVW